MKQKTCHSTCIHHINISKPIINITYNTISILNLTVVVRLHSLVQKLDIGKSKDKPIHSLWTEDISQMKRANRNFIFLSVIDLFQGGLDSYFKQMLLL